MAAAVEVTQRNADWDMNPGHVALFHSALELEREREQRQREQLITQRARERNSTVERIMTLAMRALQDDGNVQQVLPAGPPGGVDIQEGN